MKTPLQNERSLLLILLIIALSIFSLSSCVKDAATSNSVSSLSASQALSGDRTFPANIDTAGLVAWYDFNNGGTKDRSVYHNDIAFNNAKRTTDRNGVANNAYYFNGHNYMRIPNSPSINPAKAITLFAIVKVDDFYEGQCHGNRIMDKNFSDHDNGVYALGFDDNIYTNQMNCSQPVDKAHEAFTAGYGNPPYYSAGANDTAEYIQTGRWYHVIYTFGNGISTLYVDGKQVYTNTYNVNFTPNNQDLYIGTLSLNAQYPYWFTGAIDQIGIFNVALNPYQVAKLSRL